MVNSQPQGAAGFYSPTNYVNQQSFGMSSAPQMAKASQKRRISSQMAGLSMP